MTANGKNIFSRKRLQQFLYLTFCNVPPERIFNVDKTGLTVIQNKMPHVVARKEKRHIASLTSAERGFLITLVASKSWPIHSTNDDILPKNIYHQLKKGTLSSDTMMVYHSGRIQTNMFLKWSKISLTE